MAPRAHSLLWPFAAALSSSLAFAETSQSEMPERSRAVNDGSPSVEADSSTEMGNAPNGDAVELDRKAREAFFSGDFVAAAEGFERANALVPHAATLYNVALAYDRARWWPQAADAYHRALEQSGLDEQRGGLARARLAELRRELAFVVITEPRGATVRVAHVSEMIVPVQLHVAPGSYSPVFTLKDGRQLEREFRVADAVELRLEFSIVEESSKQVRDQGRPSVSARPAPDRTWGWVALAGGAAFAGTGTLLGLQTLSVVDQYDQGGQQDAALRERAVRLRLWTNVAWGAAVVSAAAGVVLFTIDTEAEPLVVSSGLQELTLSGTF